MSGLGYKQRQLLERAEERGKLVLNRKAINICGNKQEAKRVVKTLESRNLLEYVDYGTWKLSEKGETKLEEAD